MLHCDSRLVMVRSHSGRIRGYLGSRDVTNRVARLEDGAK